MTPTARLPRSPAACRVLAVIGAMVLATVWLPPSAASAAGCGPAGQPCTWNFDQANVYPAQQLGGQGAGVTVAVVDTWVDPQHPDFGGRVVDEADCIGGCRDHTYAPDDCEHGTHVAGTVGSAMYGVAPRVRLLAVQVLSYDPSSGECSGATDDVAAGISFAAAHGARVINLSLGSLVPGLFQSDTVTAAVHAAARAGALVVFAAGNAPVPLTDDYGGDALLVAATGPNGGLASYSDYAGSVALAAPGGDTGAAGMEPCRRTTCILSTFPHNAYGMLYGTSMAAPHVSGTAALLIAQQPRRGRADVVHILEATAHPLAGAGSGRLDAAAALRLAAPNTPATARPTKPAVRRTSADQQQVPPVAAQTTADHGGAPRTTSVVAPARPARSSTHARAGSAVGAPKPGRSSSRGGTGSTAPGSDTHNTAVRRSTPPSSGPAGLVVFAWIVGSLAVLFTAFAIRTKRRSAAH